jgi:hypothetical protein
MIGKEQKTSSGNLKLGDLPDDECKDMMQITQQNSRNRLVVGQV